jgi:hypothetical protein
MIARIAGCAMLPSRRGCRANACCPEGVQRRFPGDDAELGAVALRWVSKHSAFTADRARLTSRPCALRGGFRTCGQRVLRWTCGTRMGKGSRRLENRSCNAGRITRLRGLPYAALRELLDHRTTALGTVILDPDSLDHAQTSGNPPTQLASGARRSGLALVARARLMLRDDLGGLTVCLDAALSSRPDRAAEFRREVQCVNDCRGSHRKTVPRRRSPNVSRCRGPAIGKRAARLPYGEPRTAQQRA